MTDTRWNGEPCTARRITATVVDDGAFPLYWARHLVGTRRNIVEVTYGGETFYLDNEDGSGWHKVTHGGSPRWTSSSLTIDPDSIQLRAQTKLLGMVVETDPNVPPGAVELRPAVEWARQAGKSSAALEALTTPGGCEQHPNADSVGSYCLACVIVPPPGREEDAHRASRRASIRTLLQRIDSGVFGLEENDLLRRHVAAEMREADTARAEAQRQELIGLSAIRAVKELLKRRTTTLKERAERAEAAIARVRRLCELTISASIRVQAVLQARDTLAVLSQPSDPAVTEPVTSSLRDQPQEPKS